MKLKSECMLCYTGAKPPAPVGTTAVPPATIPQGSTVAPSGGPPIPAGGGGGGGMEGERPFCQSLLNVWAFLERFCRISFLGEKKKQI